ncbi:MAG: hypothetical protein A3E78_02030 [Alphaproteobacteria bacterium RIFCSPHIGHO2_12_FULL_63_12]|nr:MAG: hypothetical protein A3E78_02030 [Alphaproteobacteria bacterium RIFCSPHIGHO2_12_FULL_63_12]
MPDARFFLTLAPLAIDEVLRLAGVGTIASAGDRRMIARAESSDAPDLESAVVFVEDAARATQLSHRQFGLCFATPELKSMFDDAAGVVCCVHSPRAAFAAVATALHAPRGLAGADPSDAPRIVPSAWVHQTAIIGPGAMIGPEVEIGPYAVVGPGVVIGARTSIAENASLWCSIIGAGVKIGAGSAIGGPGFGFVLGAGGLQRVPQLGRVIIGDNVEIGANGAIDRGALGDTIIGAGVKIDNMVQIAHNVRIGENCVIAAQVGIAGSAKIGARVQFGGQVGIADHATIGDDARIAAKAGVMRNIPSGETWGGYPARPMTKWLRETAVMARGAERKKKKATDHDD